MGKTLCILNLPSELTEAKLRRLFEEIGCVVTCDVVIVNGEGGSMTATAFVEMDKEEDAKRAIDQFDGMTIQGRKIKVEEAE